MKDSKPFLAIVELGSFLRAHLNQEISENQPHNIHFSEQLNELTQRSVHHNGWFTPEQVRFSLQQWSEALSEENLTQWLTSYTLPVVTPKTVGLVLAGNIPLVGFHDFIAVLISGHKIRAKRSSNDQQLIAFMTDFLIEVQPELKDFITFVDGKLESFDAVIATGSNNTARYFEYYFQKVPNIIRKNRNSVAIINGEETHEELVALGEDIFRYFGLGCRNVSKLFIPKGYDFKPFFEAIYAHKDIIDYEKYANNYDYNKAVYLMSQFNILDNGFITVKEDTAYASPISGVFYETYNSLAEVKQRLETDRELIQCVVGSRKLSMPEVIPFGQSQSPRLNDYADRVDTLAFLSQL